MVFEDCPVDGSLISEIGNLKYTGRGASATEDSVIHNQIERERYFVIVQFNFCNRKKSVKGQFDKSVLEVE